jgi:hypothetical protein
MQAGGFDGVLARIRPESWKDEREWLSFLSFSNSFQINQQFQFQPVFIENE